MPSLPSAEARVSALTYHPKKGAGYAAALRRVLEFMRRHGTDPKTGIWYDTVTADGMPKSTGLAHSWKANYHDVRGLGRFVERFGERPKKARM